MIPVGIGNYLAYPDSSNIPASQRTLSQELAIQQRNATFYTVTVNEMELSWLIGFVISNEYFRQNPSKHSLIELHKRKTGIDAKFYKPLDGSKDNEAQKNASDSSHKETTKGDGQETNE